MKQAIKGPMNKTTKGLLMNAFVLLTLLFFYFKRTPFLTLCYLGDYLFSGPKRVSDR
jgi:hypothetical protein